MGKREEYIDKFAAQLKEWSAKIDELKARAEKETADKKIRLRQELEVLNAKKQEARNRLDHVKNAAEDAWESLAEGATRAWDDLKEAMRQAAEKFK